MYQVIFSLHSVLRWLLVLGLLGILVLYGINRGKGTKSFRTGELFKSVTVTLAHIQLLVGYYIYFESPMMHYFRNNIQKGLAIPEMAFFGIYHVTMMTIAILVLTIGSSVVKKAETYEQKRKYILIFFGIVLLMIVLAVPWPFSPFIARPYYRSF